MNLDKAEKEVGHEMTASFAAPPSHPMDYTVPDFGLDKDMLDTASNLANAEKDLGHNWNLLQLNSEVESDPICSSAGCTQYAHKKTPLGYPLDYAVPDHGRDPDVVGTKNSLSIAEAMHAHKLEMGTPQSKAKYHNVAKDVPYNFNPALDEHIIHSQENLANTESSLGHKWVIESEPAYTAPTAAPV